MAVKFRHLVVRVLLTVCVISFTIVLFGRGWTSLDNGAEDHPLHDDGGSADDEGTVQLLALQQSVPRKHTSAINVDEIVQFR